MYNSNRQGLWKSLSPIHSYLSLQWGQLRWGPSTQNGNYGQTTPRKLLLLGLERLLRDEEHLRIFRGPGFGSLSVAEAGPVCFKSHVPFSNAGIVGKSRHARLKSRSFCRLFLIQFFEIGLPWNLLYRPCYITIITVILLPQCLECYITGVNYQTWPSIST